MCGERGNAAAYIRFTWCLVWRGVPTYTHSELKCTAKQ
jgi:hypothetical protein